MAVGINISGKVDIQVQFELGASNLLDLGESMDMVDVEERAFFHNVPADSYGGPQGPPINKQFLGVIYVVRMELSRWDPTVYDAMCKRHAMATNAKVLSTEVGTLAMTKCYRLLLKCTTRPYNFPAALLVDSTQHAKGTKFSSLSLQMECHRAQAPQGTTWPPVATDGVIYDSTITAYVAA